MKRNASNREKPRSVRVCIFMSSCLPYYDICLAIGATL